MKTKQKKETNSRSSFTIIMVIIIILLWVLLDVGIGALLRSARDRRISRLPVETIVNPLPVVPPYRTKEDKEHTNTYAIVAKNYRIVQYKNRYRVDSLLDNGKWHTGLFEGDTMAKARDLRDARIKSDIQDIEEADAVWVQVE